MHSTDQNLVAMDLSFEALENLEAPMEDHEAGVWVGLALGAGGGTSDRHRDPVHFLAKCRFRRFGIKSTLPES